MASLLRFIPWLLTFIVAAILVWQTGMTLNNALTIGVIVMAVAVPVSRFAARLFKQSRERLPTYPADTPLLREEKMPVLPMLVGIALVLLLVVFWSQVSSFFGEGRTLIERGLRELQPLDQRQAADAKATSDALAQTAQLAYGPQDGQLQHDNDERVELIQAFPILKDSIAEVRLVNPYDTKEGQWDYGFFFRETDSNEQYRLYVTSAKRWDFHLWQGENRETLASGRLREFDVAAGGSNNVLLVVKGSEGFLFVNDAYVATLDTSGKDRVGRVSTVTGAVRRHEVPGKVTRFTGFTVWSLP